MTIKQLGGVFGRNPTFNDVTIDGELILNGEIFTGLDFQGSWNASTNTPTLASGVGTTGEFYIVSVAGTTNLDGITNWGVGDWAMFSGSAWQRVEGNADGNFVNLSVSNEATFPDNAKAIFGAGSDLQIYHDGTHSRIVESGGGDMIIQGDEFSLMNVAGTEYMIFADNDSFVKLYYDGSVKLATTATGIDVTGSVTADGLQVTNTATTGTDQEVASFRTASGGGLVIRSSDLSAANPDSILEPFFGESLKIKTSGNDRFKVADNGDISFYDDAAAQGLFWDSSASALGLGTTIPGQKLEIKESSTGAGDAIIRLRGDGNNANNTPLGSLEWFNTDSSGPQPGVVAAVEAQSANANGHMGKLLFKTHDGSGSEADPPTTRMTIDESGLVGIGTDLPVAKLHIENGDMRIEKDTKATIGFRGHTTGSTALAFRDSSAAVDRMTIDESGNVLVGKTSTGVATAGIELNGANDLLRIARDGGVLQELNRITSDGDIIEFRKDNSAVATIGVVNSDNLRIGGVVTDHAGLQFGTNILIPETAGTASDGLVDIGTGANRYQDVYATNGTIQTSDGNEKQDIEELSEAEQRVAVAAKGLLRKFRWKSAVEAKGDEARTHFGIIAQDLQAAFAAEGLDAGDYGMFINSTWTDEETGEERSRMGVRYSELLAFIISAI